MVESKHYPLDLPGAEYFINPTLPEALEEVAGWLRSNPDVVVLGIQTSIGDDFEGVSVFYER